MCLSNNCTDALQGFLNVGFGSNAPTSIFVSVVSVVVVVSVFVSVSVVVSIVVSVVVVSVVDIRYNLLLL